MLSPEAAERKILESIQPFPAEECGLGDVLGRVLREPIHADRDLPPFDRVTMDGYALRSSSIATGTRAFVVEGLQAAGMIARKLGTRADACVEVMTGAVLPMEADCVIPYEQTDREGATITLRLDGQRPGPGYAIHRRGSDALQGTELVPRGSRMTPQAIAAAAACGKARLMVAMTPRIAVVATGDELVEVDMAVGDHQVRRSNDHALRAALLASGIARADRFHLRDNAHEIEHHLWHILAEYDVVVLCGGVSKGKLDHVPTVLKRLGVSSILHGVAQRPGKPMAFGISQRGTPVFALPGNPVSAFVCLHRYVLPAIRHASGERAPAVMTVGLTVPVPGLAALAQYIPATLEKGAPGWTAVPRTTHTSGDFVALVGTDGFVELPPSKEAVPAGAMVAFRPWAGA
jgi:molybdopterin molybdotransferase